MGAKEIFGIVLLVLSFGYLILNPGQSLMDGLMKQKKEKYEAMKAEAEAKAAAAQATEAEAEVIEE
ncbi:MAG: hypothetical protein IKU44_02270 [Firmicutes bacterium]|nr:hypothetical protein [Bacillota bacterium]